MMHQPKLSDFDLNLIARALDTLAEQTQALKANIVSQVQEAQRAAATPPEAPAETPKE